MEIHPGSYVIVKAYPNKELSRRVIAVHAGTAVLTTEEEWQRSLEQNREPICVGFPIRDVVRVDSDKMLGGNAN